jgi:cellulose biosynthesis protein BcsQ
MTTTTSPIVGLLAQGAPNAAAPITYVLLAVAAAVFGFALFQASRMRREGLRLIDRSIADAESKAKTIELDAERRIAERRAEVDAKLNTALAEIQESQTRAARREETLDSIIEPTAEKNLFVAPAPTGHALAEVEAQLVAEMFPQPRLKDAIDACRDDWDYVLLDCPPTLGRLTVNAFMAADAILAPVQCQYFALEGLRDLSEVAHRLSVWRRRTDDFVVVNPFHRNRYPRLG